MLRYCGKNMGGYQGRIWGRQSTRSDARRSLSLAEKGHSGANTTQQVVPSQPLEGVPWTRGVSH
jgi:hypothetical protein